MHRLLILPRWPYMVLLFATLPAFVSHQSSETAMSIPKSFWKPYCVMMTPNVANVYGPNFFASLFHCSMRIIQSVPFAISIIFNPPCYRMDETRPFGVEEGEKDSLACKPSYGKKPRLPFAATDQPRVKLLVDRISEPYSTLYACVRNMRSLFYNEVNLGG